MLQLHIHSNKKKIDVSLVNDYDQHHVNMILHVFDFR